jgi:hypothetical protein
MSCIPDHESANKAILTYLKRLFSSFQHNGTEAKPALPYQIILGSLWRSGFSIESDWESMSEYDSMATCDTYLLVVVALFEGFPCGCLNSWKHGQTTSLTKETGEVTSTSQHPQISCAIPVADTLLKSVEVSTMSLPCSLKYA